MDTLTYFHLAATYEASANLESEVTPNYTLFFEELNWANCRNRASMSLLLFAMTLFAVSLASPTLALEKGNTGSQVTSLQNKLQAAGYFNGPVTGYYGNLTQEAVINFQKANGLSPNGMADDATLQALESSSESTPSQPSTSPFGFADDSQVLPSQKEVLEKGNRSPQVTSLQKNLQAAGYFDGPITGYYGNLTQEAVINFQKAKGLTANGIADDATLQALESNSGTPTPSQPATPEKVVTDDPKVSRRSTLALQKGNRSPQVTSLQKKLQSAGYFDGPITGYYGSLTQEAVINFQKAKGLTANGIADEETLQALESSSVTPTPSEKFTSPSGFTNNSKVENRGNLDTPQKTSPSIQKTPQQISPSTDSNAQKTSPSVQKTPQKISPSTDNDTQETSPSVQKTPQATSPSTDNDTQKTPSPLQNEPQKTSPLPQGEMKLKQTISGNISPKSVVHSGTGLFFAQNMMYSHTITVYDRNHKLVKTIPDAVNLTKYGYSKFEGNYKGAPVEASFSHNGKYAWVSNYQMYGSGFNNPGSDECSPSQKTDKSFLYRINTENLKIEKVVQVGSVPKYVEASPDNRLVLVSNWCSWDLSVVDTEKNKEIKRIQLGRYPRGIVVDANSDKAYVAVMGSSDIATVDLNNFSVGWLNNIGHSPRHLNIDPAGKYLYATLNGEGTVAKVELPTGKVLNKVVTGSAPRSMVISDDGQRLYVVNYNSNTVSKVRTSDMKVLQSVNVNDAPIGITYDAQTREVWVACYSGSIMVFQD